MSVVSADVPNGMDALINFQAKRKAITPRFDCIGTNPGKGKMKGFDKLCEVMRNLSKTGTWLFWWLIESRDIETNIAVFRAKDNLEAKKVSKAYKELHSAGIVKRVKKAHYLLNPKVYFPLFDEFDAVLTRWNSI